MPKPYTHRQKRRHRPTHPPSSPHTNTNHSFPLFSLLLVNKTQSHCKNIQPFSLKKKKKKSLQMSLFSHDRTRSALSSQLKQRYHRKSNMVKAMVAATYGIEELFVFFLLRVLEMNQKGLLSSKTERWAIIICSRNYSVSQGHCLLATLLLFFFFLLLCIAC